MELGDAGAHEHRRLVLDRDLYARQAERVGRRDLPGPQPVPAPRDAIQDEASAPATVERHGVLTERADAITPRDL
jgi:hypothetical protein